MDWSLKDAVTMERRHVVEGKRRVVRQEELMRELVEQGHDHVAVKASDLLVLLQEMLELSQVRLRYLEISKATTEAG